MIEISVIIPVFNSSTTILRCLTSLKKSSLTNYEIIVIDDCSSDDSFEVVKKYISEGNSNVRLIKNEKNLGPSFSRKRGIEAANGAFLAFTDSDDYVEPGFLDRLFLTHKKEKADITICNYFTVGNKGKKKAHLISEKHSGNGKNDQLIISVDSFWLCFVSKRMFDGVVFPNIRNGEDMAVIPQLLEKAEKVAFVRDPLYNYVYYKNSLSNAYSDSKLNSLIASFEMVYSLLGSKYPKEIEYLGIRNLVYGGLLAIFKHSNNKTLAIKLMDEFEKKYQRWEKSKYICELPFYKKAFVKNAKKRRWWFVRFLSIMHSLLVRE